MAPKLKPKKINLVPSKLRLNKKSFKEYKNNKETNNYSYSCPNSEEDESDLDYSP